MSYFVPFVVLDVNVVPVFRKSDKQQASNYRPVSLLCICGKAMERAIFRSSVRKDLMAACFVCQSVSQSVSQCVKLLVYTVCIIHIFLTQRRIRFICGVLMPYNVGNIMQVDMLGSKVIKGVLLDETLR